LAACQFLFLVSLAESGCSWIFLQGSTDEGARESGNDPAHPRTDLIVSLVSGAATVGLAGYGGYAMGTCRNDTGDCVIVGGGVLIVAAVLVVPTLLYGLSSAYGYRILSQAEPVSTARVDTQSAVARQADRNHCRQTRGSERMMHSAVLLACQALREECGPLELVDQLQANGVEDQPHDVPTMLQGI
jgi:hypothetical protein